MSQIYKNSEGFSYKYPENHPIVSLIYLLMVLILSYFVFSSLGIAVGVAIYGPDVLATLPQLISGELTENLTFLKIFLAISSIGTFTVPAVLLKFIERHRTFYLDLSVPKPLSLIAITVAILLVSSPFLELTSRINQEMQLPGFLSEMEEWMKMKELEMQVLTQNILRVSSISGLLVNLLVIAVIPAIGEELFFRGCLQPIFHRWTKNAHLAIWITAIIFAAIHVQFYGFIPRMLMGAVFGYMLYWGRSIWLPIIAHFVNNATAVIYTFVLLRQGKTFEEIDSEMVGNWMVYVLSIGLLCFLLYRYWKLSKTAAPPSDVTIKTYP